MNYQRAMSKTNKVRAIKPEERLGLTIRGRKWGFRDSRGVRIAWQEKLSRTICHNALSLHEFTRQVGALWAVLLPQKSPNASLNFRTAK